MIFNTISSKDFVKVYFCIIISIISEYCKNKGNMGLGGIVVSYKSVHNESDLQIISEEINMLKEKLKTLKEETITKENINLLQELDEELTRTLLKYFDISNSKNTFKE